MSITPIYFFVLFVTYTSYQHNKLGCDTFSFYHAFNRQLIGAYYDIKDISLRARNLRHLINIYMKINHI